MDASIKYFPLIALIVPVLSMFRLAKFNVDDRQSMGFLGVPTPLNTLFLTFFPLLLWFDFEKWTVAPLSYMYVFDTYIVGAVTVLMAFLMVTEIPLMALKFKSFRWSENKLKFIFLILSLILIVVLKVWSIPLIVFLYLILSIFSFTKQKKENEIQSRN
jgi:CDP-diacylglycerol--serine O-phosphatidyltransferase